MCELGQSSPLVRYSRQNLWAEAATAHVLLGGPRLHVLQVLVRSEGPLWLRPILDVNSP